MSVGMITVNVNGLRNKKAELMCFISNVKQIYSDVILMLNDTRLHGGLDFSIPGFSLIRGDKNTGDSTPGGAAIAVPNTWDIQACSRLIWKLRVRRTQKNGFSRFGNTQSQGLFLFAEEL